MNLTQQMDSGANKNITNDLKIIRNFTTISSIPIFGIGDDMAACHITGKGIIVLSTIDGSTLDIIMIMPDNVLGRSYLQMLLSRTINLSPVRCK